MKNILVFAFILLSTCAQAQTRTIHVFVALCDNVNQGIVPVPSTLGNGQDPRNNLYWGAMYGVKSFLKNKSGHWTLVSTVKNPSTEILERALFKHNTEDVFLIADAYDGIEIEQCTIDFFKACAGQSSLEVTHGDREIQFGGASSLIAYIGHNGLMEFNLDQQFENTDGVEREAIMLACISKSFFGTHLKSTGAYPLLWTSNLMAPEAYTLEWAIDSWIKNESREEVRLRGAHAYNHYQKCGLNGAKGLLVGGW